MRSLKYSCLLYDHSCYDGGSVLLLSQLITESICLCCVVITLLVLSHALHTFCYLLTLSFPFPRRRTKLSAGVLLWDATNLPLSTSSVDVIVSDLVSIYHSLPAFIGPLREDKSWFWTGAKCSWKVIYRRSVIVARSQLMLKYMYDIISLWCKNFFSGVDNLGTSRMSPSLRRWWSCLLLIARFSLAWRKPLLLGVVTYRYLPPFPPVKA